jgi:hypothetical protein
MKQSRTFSYSRTSHFSKATIKYSFPLTANGEKKNSSRQRGIYLSKIQKKLKRTTLEFTIYSVIICIIVMCYALFP